MIFDAEERLGRGCSWGSEAARIEQGDCLAGSFYVKDQDCRSRSIEVGDVDRMESGDQSDFA